MPDSKRPQVPDEAPTTKAGRLTVFSVKQTANGSVWVKAGSAWTNRDVMWGASLCGTLGNWSRRRRFDRRGESATGT
jgi:hypothetical protein